MTNDAKNVIFTTEGNPDSFREVPTAYSQTEPEELAEDILENLQSAMDGFSELLDALKK